ncbi:hypothetical protein [Barrientosiimonas humi]|uniref:hypothetical protein n=1 Tax=Barrientosiimonas humi TaxID=999931 RepID=UPI001152E7B0|nr:hypothetical protein [Barrientosiimonas humi]
MGPRGTSRPPSWSSRPARDERAVSRPAQRIRELLPGDYLLRPGPRGDVSCKPDEQMLLYGVG